MGGGEGNGRGKKTNVPQGKKHERAETICMKMSGGTHGRYATFLPSITVGGMMAGKRMSWGREGD